jgi:prolyl-tRNA editing enzyme YbaK/EbsC (Cys-tRNA(Pro) deacylase)
MVSGAHRVDTTKAAALLGVDGLNRATPDQVFAATGQRIGGVSPVAHPSQLRTLVDSALQDYQIVWAAGGVPHAVFPTNFDELVQITCGTAADIA